MTKRKKTVNELLEEALFVEDEQPFQVPENWVWVTLKDVCKINMGQSPKGEYTTDDSNNIPLIGGPADMGETYPNAKRYTIKPTKLSENGELIVSVRATLGKTNIADGQYCLGRGVAGIKSNIIDIRLLRYYFETIKSYLYSVSTGTTFQQISRKNIESIAFPLLPLNEQKRIADKVERLLSKIDEAKQLIEEAKETFELRRAAILDKAFRGDLGTNVENEESITNLLSKDKVLVSTKCELPNNWVYLKLGDVVKFQGGSQPPKSVFKEEQLDDYIRLIQIRDFKSDKYKTYIPKELAKRTFVENDVMIGRYGPPVFQILRGMSGAYNVALMKAIPVKELMDNDFLYYLLQAPFIQNPVIRESHRTAGQTGVRKELIEDLSIGLPPLNEQKRIAEKVENFLKKFEVEQELVGIVTDNLAIIKQSILSKAFRGELGTNDPSEESAIELLKEVLQEQVK
ncbi:restriction endonuclease subunit S [Bacillus pumilus]|uniref:restriction endonuclease subunit S n=1 Tax=Bacillus pumilus TaxID=1408 RepID=UPI003ADD920E